MGAKHWIMGMTAALLVGLVIGESASHQESAPSVQVQQTHAQDTSSQLSYSQQQFPDAPTAITPLECGVNVDCTSVAHVKPKKSGAKVAADSRTVTTSTSPTGASTTTRTVHGGTTTTDTVHHGAKGATKTHTVKTTG